MTTSKSVPSLLSVALAFVLAVSSLAGCGGSTGANDDAGEQAVTGGSCTPYEIPNATPADQCAERECCVELHSCGADCQAFAQCLVGCLESDGGTACSAQCSAQHPSGKDQYTTGFLCVLDKCGAGDAGHE